MSKISHILQPHSVTATRVVRTITLYNLLMMLVLFVIFVAAVNVVITKSTENRVDTVMEDQLMGFNEAQQRPDHQYRRLSVGLLPIIYFKYEENQRYVNPHPAANLIPEHAEAIIARNPQIGSSTHQVGNSFYRVLHIHYSKPMQFYYNNTITPVKETISIYDITKEEQSLKDIRILSLISILFSFICFAILGYFLAHRSLIPIESAWEQQKRFAADTSHELRNPLAAIKANAELILKSPDSTVLDVASQVASILDSSNHMTSMLSTLLTLARADANEDEILYIPLGLSELVSKTTEQFRQIAEIRNITLVSNIVPEAKILGDQARIHELLDVLIDNAIRYTKPGGHIDVTLMEGHKKYILQIQDTGIGVAPQDMEGIFERFHRTQASQEINPNGTGLGLPVAKWIAERHDAVFNFESELGVGTTITLKFNKQS